MSARQTVVNEALIDKFQRDGCAVLRGAFTPWIEGLKAGIEENMANPSFRERTYVPDDGSARFFQDFCNWSRIPGYRALVTDSPMTEIAAPRITFFKTRFASRDTRTSMGPSPLPRRSSPMPIYRHKACLLLNRNGVST